MDRVHLLFTLRTSLSFLLVILLQTSSEAASICAADRSVQFSENNTVGEVVANISVQSGVTLRFSKENSDNPFRLEGNQLVAARVFDYEEKTNYDVEITCTETATGSQLPLVIVVLLINVNDNPPVFDQNPYYVRVSEITPVGTSVGRFAATDLDKPSQLYYTLTSKTNFFKLRSPTVPDLLVETVLDYDKVNNVQLVLYAQDTPLTAKDNTASFTGTTTILVTILDGDNRPPWFQPCTKHDVGGALVCQSAGYTGRVVLNEQETGVLPLKPGPLYAIDGDSGINEEIMYSFLSGNDAGLFEINPNTGNISMLKPANVLGNISLTVLAAQKTNNYQFATTTVTISVLVKSLHTPQFQKPQYEGRVTAVGTMVMDLTNKDKPLQIVATDNDYAAAEGINPHISYSIDGSSAFSIINGYLFMTKDLPEATLSLQVVAKDTSNDESATAQLSVEVATGLTTTTTVPLSTTGNMTTTLMSTTDSKTTEVSMSTNPSMSTDSLPMTTKPSTTSEGSNSTTDPSLTSESGISTTNPSLTSEGTAHPPPVIVPSGDYTVVDMAALGATLGILLFISLVVIGVLVHCIRKGKADWRKIYEANVFRSSLGQSSGAPKKGIQYTNEAFQNDEDGGSMGFNGPKGGSVMADGAPRKVVDIPLNEAKVRSLASLHALLPDNTSQAGSDKVDSEKEVKPILTKERRMEEGYKAVWFKEDIDPAAKEEVVIIPDSREDDSEEEDGEQLSSSRDEDEDHNQPIKTRKVGFADADLDSGLGVKMDDTAEDSHSDEVSTVNLDHL